MRILGGSILEAIDWVQDRLTTTRPLAERTLFSLISEKKVLETNQGFVLREDTDDDEVKHHHQRVHHRARPHGKARVVHKITKKKTRQRYNQKMKHMDHSDEADQMEDDDDAVS